MRKKGLGLIAVLSLILMVAIAGCSGTLEPGPDGEGEPAGVSTLIEGTYGDVETLDPHKATGIGTVKLSFLLYDTLLSMDRNLQIQPGLAEEWDVSPDGLTYTFKLRDGVKFHSGKALTSADVKWSFERWRDPATASPSAWRIEAVESIETPDDKTVVLNLSRPHRTLLIEMCSGFSSILNKEVVEELGDDYGLRGVDGTGPFKLVSWNRNEEMVLERHDEYTWGPGGYENPGPAKIGRYIIKVIPDGSTRMMAVETGEIDLAIHQTPFAEVPRLKESDAVKVIPYEPLLDRFIGFKTSRPTLSDVAVRKAINHAIDKAAITESVYYGYATPAIGPLSEKAYGYWDGVKDIAYEYDPEKAKEILEEAGWKLNSEGFREKDGVVLKGISIYALPYYEKDLTIVQANLAEIGIGVELKLLDVPALFPALKEGEHDMYFMNSPYESADILYEYFHSSMMPAPNRHDYPDPELDELLETWRHAEDEEEALAAMAGVQRKVMEEALWVPMYHMSAVNVVNAKNVKAYTPHPIYDTCIYKLLDAETNRYMNE